MYYNIKYLIWGRVMVKKELLKDSLFCSEMFGVVVITIFGSLLHFCYEWSGKWSPAAIFCAVNESVWEHMKIAFWPAFFYALIQYFILKDRPDNFFLAKTVGLYVTSLMIPLLFYFYTGIIGEHILVIDILIFIIAIFLGQLTNYQIMQKSTNPAWNLLALGLLLLILFAYATFTFYPPNLNLFKD